MSKEGISVAFSQYPPTKPGFGKKKFGPSSNPSSKMLYKFKSKFFLFYGLCLASSHVIVRFQLIWINLHMFQIHGNLKTNKNLSKKNLKVPWQWFTKHQK